MHHITIRNATQLSKTFDVARQAGQDQQFGLALSRLLFWLTSHVSDDLPPDVESLVIDIRPDGDIPFSFYGVTQRKMKDGTYHLVANAGLIRHNIGSLDVPRYEWSVHT